MLYPFFGLLLSPILFWAYSGFSAWVWDPAQPIPFIEDPNLLSNTFCSGHAGLANGSYLVGGGSRRSGSTCC